MAADLDSRYRAVSRSAAKGLGMLTPGGARRLAYPGLHIWHPCRGFQLGSLHSPNKTPESKGSTGKAPSLLVKGGIGQAVVQAKMLQDSSGQAMLSV
jgi:hypothetical protein